MEWSYSKEEILAMYSSYAPMGGNVVGLDDLYNIDDLKQEKAQLFEPGLDDLIQNGLSDVHLGFSSVAVGMPTISEVS